MKHIFGKIQVIVGKSSPHIVFFLISALCKFLKFRYYQIIAACPFSERPHSVVYLFAPVNAQHHICHFLIGKFHDFIIQQYTVGSQGKPEILIVNFLLLSSICYQLLYHLKIHQRFTAEKVHFQVPAVSGIFNQKIKGSFSHFIRHDCSSSVVFPFLRKAITAGQVAVMGNMQTQGFYHRGTILKLPHVILIFVFRKQLLFFSQSPDFFVSFCKLSFRIVPAQTGNNFFSGAGFKQGNHIINHVIHHMYRTAVDVQNNIVTVVFILMNHCQFLSFRM